MAQYILHGQVLEAVSSARYLGVNIFSNLIWNTHEDRITANANMSLWYIKRNIKTKSPQIREMAYQSLVRPQLEYASAVWDPRTKDKTQKVEMVQRHAVSWTLTDYTRTTRLTTIHPSFILFHNPNAQCLQKCSQGRRQYQKIEQKHKHKSLWLIFYGSVFLC